MTLWILPFVVWQAGGAGVADEKATKPPAYEVVDLGTGVAGSATLTCAFGGVQAGKIFSPTSGPLSGIRGGAKGSYRAALWRGTDDSMTDLAPVGSPTSEVSAIVKGAQYGTIGVGMEEHATIWHGSAGSAIDLNYHRMVSSTLKGGTNSVQVGNANVDEGIGPPYMPHAVIWRGTPESAIDLHPAGCSQSGANGAYGDSQIGGATDASTELMHVLLWHGSASSYVDLTPQGYPYCDGVAMSKSVQVGVVLRDLGTKDYRAILWHGTAKSATDITPEGYQQATPTATTDDTQVGYGVGPKMKGMAHAVLWHGTAKSALDLHEFLDKKFTNSMATGIDSETGDIVGSAMARDGVHAIIWRKAKAAKK